MAHLGARLSRPRHSMRRRHRVHRGGGALGVAGLGRPRLLARRAPPPPAFDRFLAARGRGGARRARAWPRGGVRAGHRGGGERARAGRARGRRAGAAIPDPPPRGGADPGRRLCAGGATPAPPRHPSSARGRLSAPRPPSDSRRRLDRREQGSAGAPARDPPRLSGLGLRERELSPQPARDLSRSAHRPEARPRVDPRARRRDRRRSRLHRRHGRLRGRAPRLARRPHRERPCLPTRIRRRRYERASPSMASTISRIAMVCGPTAVWRDCSSGGS